MFLENQLIDQSFQLFSFRAYVARYTESHLKVKPGALALDLNNRSS